MPKEMMHVVASADELYAPHLGTMFLSILKNTKFPDDIMFYVLDGGISASTKQDLRDLVLTSGAQLTWFSLESEYAAYPSEKWLTRAAYFRLSIPELLHGSVPKALYLDCDLIVRHDIEQIWATDIEEFCLGAVENISDRTFRKCGVPQSEYFNSGVMLLNLDRWRKEGIADRVRAQLFGEDASCTNDQDALNRVLHTRWKRLPLRWNMQSGMYRPHSQLKKYTEKETDEALFDPAIVHYVGWSKPWTYLSYHPLQGVYWAFRNQTPWAAEVPEGRNLLNRVRRFSNPSLLKKLARQKMWRRRYRERGWSEI